MEYKVTLILTIYNSDRTKWASGYKVLDLPFVPFVGLELRESRNGYTQPINRVVYYPEDKEFKCYIVQDERICEDHSVLDLLFYIKQAKRNGWAEIEEVFDS